MIRIIGIITLIATLVSCGMARDGSLIGARKALEKGQYEKALRKLSMTESYGEMSMKTKIEVIFLRAKTYEKQNNIAAAIGAYKYLVTNFPNSEKAYIAEQKIKELE